LAVRNDVTFNRGVTSRNLALALTSRTEMA